MVVRAFSLHDRTGSKACTTDSFGSFCERPLAGWMARRRYNERMTDPGPDDLPADVEATPLNEAQREAVHARGPLIVLAGPGTGKTHVITHRIWRLIHEDGAQPQSILALTFTNKAAEEMRTRLGVLLDSPVVAERIVASTFHSFGLRLVRQFGDRVGLRAEPDHIDEAQQKALMRRIVDETGIGREQWFYDPYSIVPTALRFVSESRNYAISPAMALDYAQRWFARVADNERQFEGEELIAEKERAARFSSLARLYDAYEQLCRQRGVVTFDDLQTLPLQILRENENLRAIVRSDFRHIIVDEFQDVNPAQVELLKCLAGPEHDLCVVGDDDQAIYAFRGAMQSSFHRFQEHWSTSRTIELTQNYRSSPVILAGADVIIRGCSDRFAQDKTTVAAGVNREVTAPIEMVSYRGTCGAGPVIGRMIQKAIEGGASYRDFAVLVRSNTDLDRIAASLQVLDIPVETPERGTAFEHPAVADVLSWMRLLADEHEDTALTRLLLRPPYNVALPTVSAWHAAHRRRAAEADKAGDEQTASMPFVHHLIESRPSETIERFARHYTHLAEVALTQPADVLTRAIIHSTGLLTVDPVDSIEHRARVEQLGRWLAFVTERLSHIDPPRRVGPFIHYLDDLTNGSLESIPASVESRMNSGVELSDRDAVRLLTAHGSKGLEFETVFIPRVNPQHGYPTMDRGSRDELLLPDDLTRGVTSTHDDDERRVFFVAMTRARRRLVLLAQTMQDSGRKLSPSAYWREIEAAGSEQLPLEPLDAVTSDEAIDAAGLAMDDAMTEPGRSVRDRKRLQLRHEIFALLHELSDPAAPVDRLATARQELQGAAMQLPILAAESPARLKAILDAAERADRDRLSELAKTIERDEPLIPLIAGPSAPLELNFSEIDQYLRCPRCYWLRSVVGVPEARKAAANFGSIIHRSLEFFYKQIKEAENAPDERPLPTLDDLLRIGLDAYDQMRPPEEIASRDTAQRVELALRQYHEQMHSPRLHVLETELRIRFPHEHGGHRHFITARIDRLDQDDAGVHVIDYKTGYPTKTKLEPKRDDLQLGLYIMATQHYFEDEQVGGTAEYWLTRTGERGVLPFEDARLDKVAATVNEAIEGILNGRWEKNPDCTKCDALLLGTDQGPEPAAEED